MRSLSKRKLLANMIWGRDRMRRKPVRQYRMTNSLQCENFVKSMAVITLHSIEDGGYVAVDTEVDGIAESLILYRSGDEVRAWLNVCPHAGRRLDWAPGQFLKAREGELVCAVHGATFEPGAGLCIAGPCRGQSLRAVAVEVREGQVLLAGTPAL